MGYGNFSYVIDSSFRPYTFSEMIQPLAIYKDAYEKSETAYEELSDKSDKFKYLSETLPEGSKARHIYEGYANELNKQAQDLAKHGLNMGNRRALTNLKRRYQGEIGRLVSADEAMQEEKKLRRNMSAKDPSLLYGVDNLSIDQFLDGETPNLYSVSGDDLYKRGAQAAQSASSRIYENTQVSNLTKYYQEITQRMGYSPKRLAQFRDNLEAIPEFRQAVDSILEEKGVNANLTGNNYERARQSVINGIMDGAAYRESRNVQQNPGVLTAAQAASNALGWANHNLSVAAHGMTKDKNNKYVSQDEWMYSHDENGRRNGYSDEYVKAVKEGLVPGKNVKIGANGKPATTTKDTKTEKEPLKKAMVYDKNGNAGAVKSGANAPAWGKPSTYDEAVQVNPGIANHHPGFERNYDYYINGNSVTIIPRGTSASSEGQSVQESNQDVTGIDDEY